MNKVVNTIRAVIMFTLLLFILIFCFQNREEVSITFLKINIEQLPLFIALLGTLSVGLLIGFLAGMISGTKSRRNTAREEANSREVRIKKEGAASPEKETPISPL